MYEFVQAANKIRENLDLPKGYVVACHKEGILIGTARLAFVLTDTIISEGEEYYLNVAKSYLKTLKEILSKI